MWTSDIGSTMDSATRSTLYTIQALDSWLVGCQSKSHSELTKVLRTRNVLGQSPSFSVSELNGYEAL